jgi:hypothetical protein
MAAFANMTLGDGQTTPVNHTFTANQGGLLLPDGRFRWVWRDFSVNDGLEVGANRIEMDVRLPSRMSNRKSAKAGDQSLTVAGMIVVPAMETLSNNTASGINPQPTHAYDTTVWFKVVRNGRAAQAPVKDALAFLRNFSQNSQFVDTVLTYGTPT